MLNALLRCWSKTRLAAAIALLLTTLPAHAIPLSPGDNVLNSFNLAPASTASFDFEPTGELQVSIISIAGSGFPSGDDLSAVLFGIDGADTGFTTFSNNGLTSSAEGMLPSFFVSTPFSLDFATPGAAESVGITYTFVAEEVPFVTPVPLPASGLMLGLILLACGGWAVHRRYKA
ncbi:MAG: hypothetical protein AAFX07_07320 [Pseudomonadota bacterium]